MPYVFGGWITSQGCFFREQQPDQITDQDYNVEDQDEKQYAHQRYQKERTQSDDHSPSEKGKDKKNRGYDYYHQPYEKIL